MAVPIAKMAARAMSNFRISFLRGVVPSVAECSCRGVGSAEQSFSCRFWLTDDRELRFKQDISSDRHHPIG
jgi:hypothetical protein